MLEFPLINDTSRKIIHIDMDAFFAQVEMRMTPVLRTNRLLSVTTLEKQGDVVWYQPVITRLENMVSIQPCLLRKPMNVVLMLSLSQEIIVITER